MNGRNDKQARKFVGNSTDQFLESGTEPTT